MGRAPNAPHDSTPTTTLPRRDNAPAACKLANAILRLSLVFFLVHGGLRAAVRAPFYCSLSYIYYGKLSLDMSAVYSRKVVIRHISVERKRAGASPVILPDSNGSLYGGSNHLAHPAILSSPILSIN
ncbi:hypothetical protein KSP40_PGU000885 [Platanthera guangdongensis]|uniref:Uncharacterized protein n=1 Tax=Platanthera guangdongensis TaxID=2320717 RepID=A0ABR2LDI9_9ASPA